VEGHAFSDRMGESSRSARDENKVGFRTPESASEGKRLCTLGETVDPHPERSGKNRTMGPQPGEDVVLRKIKLAPAMGLGDPTLQEPRPLKGQRGGEF